MAKADVASVDAYIALQPEANQGALAHVRRAIRKSVPAAEEMISYKIPAYKLDGKVLLYFAGWKQHYSLYPAPKSLLLAFEKELKPYISNKATLRFPITEPVPVALIAKVAKFRARELSQDAKQSPKSRTKT